MQIVNADLIRAKKILLRLDIDVPLGKVGDRLEVIEDFRLRAGIPTIKLCLENASKVILVGHLGRPFANASEEVNGRPQDLSARPVCEWFKDRLKVDIEFAESLEEVEKSNSKVILLENTRFFHGEVPGADYHATCTSKTCDADFAKQLAGLGEFYINEAFASHNPGASTTIVPTLLPHAAGLRFAKEVEELLAVRNHPKKPLIAIMGGAKVADKLPVIAVLARSADAVLVGGKLIHEIREERLELPNNVLVGKLNADGFDIAPETTSAWNNLISKATMIVWNGPVGKFEDLKYDQTKYLAEEILASGAQIIIGGGDSIAALNQYGLLGIAEKKAFVSTGGGAMLKLISDGTLPTIEALV